MPAVQARACVRAPMQIVDALQSGFDRSDAPNDTIEGCHEL